MAEARRLAVLGSPVAHSKSPALHRAAYGVLGLPWRYDAIEMTSDRLPAFLGGLSADAWVGLSLTMPLKRDVVPLLGERSELVELTGVANTVALRPGGTAGFNTDVTGIVAALGDHGVGRVSTAHIIGTGATAASAFVALSRMGASRILVTGRRIGGSAEIERLGARLGVHTRLRLFGESVPMRSEVVVNALPGGVEPDDVPEADLGEVLVEVPYEPWPTARASRWSGRGDQVVSGIEMLLHQAIAQVRVFVAGDEHDALPRESEVIAAMRSAVGLGAAPGVEGS